MSLDLLEELVVGRRVAREKEVACRERVAVTDQLLITHGEKLSAAADQLYRTVEWGNRGNAHRWGADRAQRELTEWGRLRALARHQGTSLRRASEVRRSFENWLRAIDTVREVQQVVAAVGLDGLEEWLGSYLSPRPVSKIEKDVVAALKEHKESW